MGSEVRKGAWSQEEDVLLRNCIQANGEGNWHQVPAKAGLNRCRKSCRLRWLNYLKPNLKRGEFEEDEVDLMLKLHKLLGNRWAMIARRLPGRTANDVKNYWNTHLAKKMPPQAAKSSSSSSTRNKSSNVVRVQAIRPQPRTFKNILWQRRTIRRDTTPTCLNPSPLNSGSYQPPPPPPPPPPPIVFPPESEISWWESLLADNVNGGEEGALFSTQENSNAKGGSFEDSLWTRSLEDHHIVNKSNVEKLGFDLELWDLIY